MANALLGLSAVLLLISAFDVTYYIGETSVTEWYSFFGYFKHASEIQARLDGVAFGWAKGGYATIGILMALSVLAPLALIAKNVILLIKKDRAVIDDDIILNSKNFTETVVKFGEKIGVKFLENQLNF